MHKSNVEWARYTWNPITGCYKGCSCCYAKRSASRFTGDVRMNISSDNIKQMQTGGYTVFQIEKLFKANNGGPITFPTGFYPSLHTYRLDWLENIKSGGTVIVSSLGEMFGPWIPDSWIQMVFDACKKTSKNKYAFLTSYPERYVALNNAGLLSTDENMWYGSTVTGNNSPIFCSDSHNTFLNVEPLMEDITNGSFAEDAERPIANWVIIGAEISQKKNKSVPKIEWIQRILAHCDKFSVPVFMCDSLADVIGIDNLRKEYPVGFNDYELSEKRKAQLVTRCAGCSAENYKSSMHGIFAKHQRGEYPESLGFLCDKCYLEMLNKYNWNKE